MKNKEEENTKKTYTFLKIVILSLVVGLIINSIIILFLQQVEIKNFKDIFNNNLIIPYAIFIIFKAYEIFIASPNKEEK
ncbi:MULTISPECIES: hypothetical protein [Flavobacterium]|uniref:Uncharacterized protein n=1 Tax=Flavobacterium jumunjinense TaxID=998845 RepID=A0ABV5GU73_9FLAO|nr:MULTISPECIES: hypothetical protein [Flavobacterium]